MKLKWILTLTETFSPFFYLFRSADYDRGPGGLWEILPAAGHARRDADHRGESLLEQVRRYSNTSESEELSLVPLRIQTRCERSWKILRFDPFSFFSPHVAVKANQYLHCYMILSYFSV